MPRASSYDVMSSAKKKGENVHTYLEYNYIVIQAFLTHYMYMTR